MQSKITFIKAREILDSRGIPTVETEVFLNSGITVKAISPAGTSTGKYEAFELRDGDLNWYNGQGVKKSVNIINGEIRSALIGKDACQQEEIDFELCKLDGTNNKSRLGANSIVSLSYAIAKAGAQALNIPLYQYLAGDKEIKFPLPWLLIMGGGIHSGGTVDFQEFLIAPRCAKSYRECFYISWKIREYTWKILSDKYNYGLLFSLGGGLAPSLSSNEEAISILVEAIKKAGYRPGIDIYIYIDVAASNFFRNGKYLLSSKKSSFSSNGMINYLLTLINKYPISVLEDGLDQDDWEGWKNLTNKVGGKIELIGDDLFVTNSSILERGQKEKIANSVLVKVNQIGTISEALKTVTVAKKGNYRTVFSARSGESEDPIISHLSIGFGVDGAKFGGLMGAESTCVLNELIRIEEKTKGHVNYSWK